MFSKRELEGYVMIDHRMSPGFSEEEAHKAHAPPVGAGKLFESATFTCGHCWPSKVVIMNPDRSRARGYCPKCDRYVCDTCETTRVLTGECNSRKKQTDEWFERVIRGESNGT